MFERREIADRRALTRRILRCGGALAIAGLLLSWAGAGILGCRPTDNPAAPPGPDSTRDSTPTGSDSGSDDNDTAADSALGVIPGWDTAFAIAGQAFPDDTLLQRSVPVRGNGYRLSRFFAKCARGGIVRIGFIGGSITGGARASNGLLRFSSRLAVFLNRLYPQTIFAEANAGIGATNSRFGCSRVQEDLLDQGPDLIVIEFAVNDDYTDTASTARAIEGLLRHCLASNPDVPVLLFQTMAQTGPHANHEVQDSLARHYGVPVVSYYDALWPWVAENRIPWTSLSADDVHPNDTGHLACAYLLYAFLRKEAARTAAHAPKPMAIAAPMGDTVYAHAGFFEKGDSLISVSADSGWAVGLQEHGRYGFTSKAEGDRLTLKSRAREVTLMYQFSLNLDAVVEIKLDGQAVGEVSNHFAQDYGGGFLKPLRLYLQADRQEHTIELTNMGGGEFDLRYVLVSR